MAFVLLPVYENWMQRNFYFSHEFECRWCVVCECGCLYQATPHSAWIEHYLEPEHSNGIDDNGDDAFPFAVVRCVDQLRQLFVSVLFVTLRGQLLAAIPRKLNVFFSFYSAAHRLPASTRDKSFRFHSDSNSNPKIVSSMFNAGHAIFSLVSVGQCAQFLVPNNRIRRWATDQKKAFNEFPSRPSPSSTSSPSCEWSTRRVVHYIFI